MSQTIGIVGGGQLGRMLTEPAIKLGYNVVVIDPVPDCPAKQVGAEQIVADYKDGEALLRLAEKSDFITIEFEHINTDVLATVEKNKPVSPATATIRLIQDKLGQKRFLRQNGFPTAEFVEINKKEDAEQAYDKWGEKMILKSKTDAFDGRGNAVVIEKSQISEILEKFKTKGIYAEKLINFKKELAMMVAKDVDGNVSSYPLTETMHERNICTATYTTADIGQEIAEKAVKIAESVVSSLKGAGMYGVELFLSENNEILINEIAPRVHNSGHYTMDMFDVSQFKQHILAITGQKLAAPKPKAKYCCMVNILGERDGPVQLSGVDEARKIEGVNVYIYGKKPTKIDRKMGHINATAGTIEEAKQKAREARKLINI